MTEQPTQPPQGRVLNTLTLLWDLVKYSPLLALVVITGVIPVMTLIVLNATSFNWEPIPALILIEGGLIILVCLPLIIVKGFMDLQTNIAQQREEAVRAEAQRRQTAEDNKQHRLNEITDAKIRNLEAQTSLALSQSDRALTDSLKATSEELADSMKQGTDFVDQAACAKNVVRILEELASIHRDYDTIFESLQKIERAMIGPDAEGSNWEGIAEFRQSVIEELEKEIDELKDEVESLKNELSSSGQAFARPADPSPPPFVPTDPVSTELKIEVQTKPSGEIEVTQEADLKAALGVVDSMTDKEEPPNIEDNNPELAMREQRIIETAQDNGIPVPKALTVWTCTKCETQNSMKITKCSKCNLGKAASEELASLS